MLPIPFGNPQTYAGHSGIDFPQPRGTQFRASGPGVIGLRSSNARGGNIVWVDYDGYPGVAYAHLDDYTDSPPVGSRVVAGQVIGRVGSSGASTGPHLHVEVYGHATSAGFWQFFSRSVVGASASAGAAVDQVTKDRQSWLNRARGESLAVDGIEGPATRAAYGRYQAFLGVAQDGVWGPVTQAAHQRYYDSMNRPQIAVDGAWGPATTRALQAALGVAQDGVLGPDTYRALQARTGSAADGIWGPNSKRALQRHLGVPDDGEIGPQTVTALQQRLNAGNL